VHSVRATLWHVDPLLGNDREIISYTIAVAKQWLCKQRPSLGNGRNRHTRNRRAAGSGVLCAFVPRLYNKGRLPLEKSLETAVRRLGGWYEMAASLGVIQLEQWVSCETVAGQLLLVTICKCSINPITNPNPIYSHSIHVTVHSSVASTHVKKRNGVIAVGKEVVVFPACSSRSFRTTNLNLWLFSRPYVCT
jgi:hypothetical protein